MTRLLPVLALILLISCATSGNENEYDITSRFNGTWNIYEGLVKNGDGSITYYALPWGGLVGSVKEHNMPADWSGYESLVVEFAEPTKSLTQIMLSDKLKSLGKVGITSLVCNLDGQDVKSVDEVAIQAEDTTTLKVKRIYLVPGNTAWSSTTIWSGKCELGNWAKGFVVKPENFTTAYPGDKIEIVYTTDKHDPQITFWQLKTIYNATETTLEGNANEQNEWGCVMVGANSTLYRITLTENDVKNLREKGLFINGYYTIVTQCNLLRKMYSTEMQQ